MSELFSLRCFIVLKDDRSLTLALPYIVAAINEKTMYVFAACNVISIPIGKLIPHYPSLCIPGTERYYSLGFVPRIEPTHAGRNGFTVCCGYAVGLGCGEDVC